MAMTSTKQQAALRTPRVLAVAFVAVAAVAGLVCGLYFGLTQMEPPMALGPTLVPQVLQGAWGGPFPPPSTCSFSWIIGGSTAHQAVHCSDGFALSQTGDILAAPCFPSSEGGLRGVLSTYYYNLNNGSLYCDYWTTATRGAISMHSVQVGGGIERQECPGSYEEVRNTHSPPCPFLCMHGRKRETPTPRPPLRPLSLSSLFAQAKEAFLPRGGAAFPLFTDTAVLADSTGPLSCSPSMRCQI